MNRTKRIVFLLTSICILAGCRKEKPKEVAEEKKTVLNCQPAPVEVKTQECIVYYTAPTVSEDIAYYEESYDMVASNPSYEARMMEPEIKGDQYRGYEENPFLSTKTNELTTFSIDADGGAYSNTRRFISEGNLPPKESVRIEEFINFFPYKYAEPKNGDPVFIHSEISECPWNSKNHLLRIGIKGKTDRKAFEAPSNFVFLIDVSGSMEPDDKLPLLKKGFMKMTDGLNENDKISIVTYAGESAVLLESAGGSEKQKIRDAIEKLGAGGSTAGADGINTAYDLAKKNFIYGGNNRVILGTDGDFNVGISNTDELIKLIEEKRETGIFLTTLGVGRGNLNDHMMEQLANKGNGNYEYIDNETQIEKIFVHEKYKFYSIAKDCKIQMKFNPERVTSYRLIGYENRSLNNRDFEDDKKDAGEIGCSQTITAMYEVVLNKQKNNGPFADLKFRYKRPDEAQSRLLTFPIKGHPLKVKFASANQRFVTSVVCFALILKQSKYKGTANKKMILDLAQHAVGFDPHGYRKEFVEIVMKANI